RSGRPGNAGAADALVQERLHHAGRPHEPAQGPRFDLGLPVCAPACTLASATAAVPALFVPLISPAGWVAYQVRRLRSVSEGEMIGSDGGFESRWATRSQSQGLPSWPEISSQAKSRGARSSR